MKRRARKTKQKAKQHGDASTKRSSPKAHQNHQKNHQKKAPAKQENGNEWRKSTHRACLHHQTLRGGLLRLGDLGTAILAKVDALAGPGGVRGEGAYDLGEKS
jgi:hypothetical protein